MLVGRRALVGLAIASALIGCASPPPPPPPPPKPVVVGPPTDTVKIPLTDLLARTYYGNAGGIYPGGINQPPADHDSVARARRNLIKPLDVNGDESPFGKYVLVSIGMSNATQEWCSQNSGPPCTAWSSPTSQSYDRIKFGRLAPLGLSENQVQVAWVKLDDQKPSLSLPADSADANVLLTNLGLVMRALRIRYPYLRLVFLSSRIYGGYATTDLNPEAYAYESGFAVKWLIESQINEMRGQPPNPRVGTLNYTNKAAPLILWGPYLWANGTTPRSDGLTWERADFEEDGVHPSQIGEGKVSQRLIDFFKNSPYTRCWFVTSGYCL